MWPETVGLHLQGQGLLGGWGTLEGHTPWCGAGKFPKLLLASGSLSKALTCIETQFSLHLPSAFLLPEWWWNG